jgi:hypothetical protein
VNIRIRIKKACVLSHVSGRLHLLVLSSTTSLARLMNRMTHIRPDLALGLAAHGAGTCFGERISRFEQRASAQAGVATTK